MFGLSTLVTRIIIGFALVVVILVGLQVHSCQKAKQRAAESRLERAQSGATVESAKDAIATQGADTNRIAASEQLTQDNAKEIQNADGAREVVKAPVDRAGRNALCLRDAYRNSEQCRLLRANPR